ncbi:MAG: L-threonylcarbamoyladenylate synthase [Bacteroidia bacterium]
MENDIQKCLEVLRKGGVILYPTDTVWGIGCDAKNEKAVQRIFEIKKRTDSKSLIILVDHENQLNKYVREVPAIAWDLIELAEDPLTIIYDDAGSMAPNVFAEDGSVGIRICKDEFCKKLIYKFGKPIVSTSANISGERWPENFSQITDEIKNAVDYVVTWRQNEMKKSKPSKIIKLKVNGEFKIIRN